MTVSLIFRHKDTTFSPLLPTIPQKYYHLPQKIIFIDKQLLIFFNLCIAYCPDDALYVRALSHRNMWLLMSVKYQIAIKFMLGCAFFY